MAFDIRPPSGAASTDSTKSSSSKSSGTEAFSLGLAASKARSSTVSGKGSPAAAQTRSPGKQPPAPAKQPANAKSASSANKRESAADADDAGTQASSAASANSSRASSKSSVKSAKTSSAANSATDSAQDQSPSADAAAAADLIDSNPSSNSKNRPSIRGGAAARANGAGTADSATPAVAIADPTTDVSNTSGLTLLQLLSQSTEADSAAPSMDMRTTEPTDKVVDNGTASANKDANALALAMFAQAFAASLGIPPALAHSAIGNPSSTALDGAVQGLPAATSSAGSLQEMVALLAQDIAADTEGKSDAKASQSDAVTTTSSPRGNPPDTGAAMASNSAGPSPAQLGTASHFSLQHTQANTNTGELKSSVGSAAWTDELGGQLTWMTHKGLESGSLRLSPEHLGPVEVRIAVQDGDASVWFGANHPDTRAALEQALPRLREMFATQGLTLTDSGVSRESPRQSPSSAPQSIAAVSAVGSSDVSVPAAVRISLGLVDTYA